jgi:drug/metabolite transporter (DMT)-like permease
VRGFGPASSKRRRSIKVDYGLGTFYAIVTAFLLAVQEPFSALAARTLSSIDFMAFTQLALLFSLPFLIAREEARRDFVAILLDARQWPKLAVIFLVGVTGLALYDVGLSSAHPIITAAVMNLSPFWAAVVAFAVSGRSIAVSRPVFWISFSMAFCGAMAVAWSQVDADPKAVWTSLLHSKWIYALPMPAFVALSGTLVYEWFSDYDEAAVIGANFAVSAMVLLPIATIGGGLAASTRLSEQSATAVALLLVGTLAAAAAGRVFYQLSLTATRNDNGYVTMFFLLIPGISTLISLPLSKFIPTLTFTPGPVFVLGMACVSAPLVAVSLGARRAGDAEMRRASADALGSE